MPKCRYLDAFDMPHGAHISQHQSLLGYVSLLMGPLIEIFAVNTCAVVAWPRPALLSGRTAGVHMLTAKATSALVFFLSPSI